MRWPVPHGFRAQIAIISAASLAVTGLAIILIRDVISSTESTLVAGARQQCEAACRELKRQYHERSAYGGDSLQNLPAEAQDISLKGLAATVLRSYEGVEGGFYREAGARILGHVYPTGGKAPGLSEREMALLASAAAETERSGRAIRTGVWGRDIAVVVAELVGPGEGAAWALRRLVSLRDPVVEKRRWWLVALVLSAMLGMGGIVSVWYALRAGVAGINSGLRKLEEHFDHRLPSIPGEFGEISRAINQMAERRMALEAELRKQDRLAALGKVVAGVAHEIRNPLNSIRLALELLDRCLKKGTARPEEVRAAIAEIDRLDLILTRLLAFGRPVLTDRRPQDLIALARQAVKLVQDPSRQKNIEITFETDGSAELVADVDGPQIQQVLINLLLNAIEASPPSGRIEVRAGGEDQSVHVSVADSGPGIPESVQPHVFDAFFTTRPDGAGLGLSVSREIVANHGGSLSFQSGPNGATFNVVLPMERKAAGEA